MAARQQPEPIIRQIIQQGDLLRVEEAAELATVRPSTIRAWLGAGRLPRIKVGRCTRVLRRDLEDFIAAGYVGCADDSRIAHEPTKGGK